MSKTTEEPKKIELIYIGQRQLNDDDIGHSFMFGEKEKIWSKAKYCIIGNKYEATQGAPEPGKPDGNLMLSTTPKDLGPAVIDKDTIDEWRLRDKLAEQFAHRKRAHAAQKKKAPEIVKHTRELQAMYEKLRTNEDRVSFEALVMRAIRGYYNG